MLKLIAKPILDSYWVKPGVLLAGEYPRNADIPSSKMKLYNILNIGITYFLDLTTPWEGQTKPYEPILREMAEKIDVSVIYKRMPIPDYSIPTEAYMKKILSTVDKALSQHHAVYVHCFGGTGRTGTVVGCYLARHGMTGEEALDTIAMWRQGTPDAARPSPETEAQRHMVLTWRIGA